MNTLTAQMLTEIYGQQSGDAFLTLLTITHDTLPTPIRLVNNTEQIISNGQTYSAFPFKIVLPVDDGESLREVALELDNTSLELINLLRTVTDPLDVNLKMILASIPNDIQYELGELKIGSITYDKSNITAKLYQDNFMSSGLTSERYTPQNFPGLF
jgi:hypothetical protein